MEIDGLDGFAIHIKRLLWLIIRAVGTRRQGSADVVGLPERRHRRDDIDSRAGAMGAGSVMTYHSVVVRVGSAACAARRRSRSCGLRRQGTDRCDDR